MDAERIELEADSVDGVLCRFGYMLMPDPAAALAETRRVLRPGGRVALAVWGAMERNPFFTIVAISLVQRGHLPPPEPPGPPVFSMAGAERTRRCSSAPGSPACGPRRCRCASSVPDVEGYLSLVADTAGPLGLALRAALGDGPRGGRDRRRGLARALRRGARLRDPRRRALRGGRVS